MKSATLFDSLFIMDETLMRTGSGDPSTSVPFFYDGSDFRETVDVKTESFAIETGITDMTGSGLESISCWIALTMSRSFPSDTVWTKTRSTPQWSTFSFARKSCSSAHRAAPSTRRRGAAVWNHHAGQRDVQRNGPIGQRVSFRD